MNTVRNIWPSDLGVPIDPMDNVIRYRAQSTLTGVEMRDGGPAPILPVAQSRDVVAWSERRLGWSL